MTRPAGRLGTANGAFAPLALLFAALYGAYGTESPFFPSFLSARGLSAGGIGIVLAVGTLVRLAAGPIAGVIADRVGVRSVLATSLCGAGIIICGYLAGVGFWLLLLVAVLHSIATAPLTALADTLALRPGERATALPYGWIRGIGSASFIVGTLASGLLVARLGLDAIIVVAGALFVAAALPVVLLPARTSTAARIARGDLRVLWTIPAFRQVLAVAALVIGSHAMVDSFAVLQWRAAGLGAGSISLLWSAGVASEVLVFVLLGPPLLARWGPARCATLGAVAGAVRWLTLAATTDIVAIAATQLLHGLTFSLVHLACMQVLARRVPGEVFATAQTVYGTLGLGLASAVLTMASGWLYGAVGSLAFLPMAAACVAALPITRRLPAAEAPERTRA